MFGEPNVAKLQQQIDSSQFAEWYAYHLVEPFGDDWDQAAQITQAVLSQYSKKPIKLEDCKPSFKPRSADDVAATLHAYFKRLSERPKRGRHRRH